MPKRQLFPSFVASATGNSGVSRVMAFLDTGCPSPPAMPAAQLAGGGGLTATADGEAASLLFRAKAEPHGGDHSFFRD